MPPEQRRQLFAFGSDTGNLQLGFVLMGVLFLREHNRIARSLAREYPGWDDERLFQQARLVNAALLAKIHTVEWSTAILPREVITTGLKTNWYGRFSRLQNVFPKLADNDIFSGIPGSPTEHHGVPFALTEEFVTTDGHIQTPTLKSQGIIPAKGMPEVECIFIEE